MRAARALRRAFAQHARLQGEQSWQAPAITDWHGWLTQLYSDLPGLPALLSPIQEEVLWKQVQAGDAAAVVSPQALARLAQSGYGLLSAYGAQASRRASWAAAHEDAERFLAWANDFDALCDRLDVLPPAEIEAQLRRHLPSLAGLPRELVLLGFDRLTPAQQGLLSAFQQAGIVVTQAALPATAGLLQLFTAGDEDEELRACALWVRTQLQRNPDARIGVLVPELQGARAAIDRTFRRILQPDATDAAPPYEFSLGSPLGSVPLVAAALLLLRWLASPLPAAEVTSLLTGGFFAADAHESLELALLDIDLRRSGAMTAEVSLAGLLRHAGAHAPAFTARMRDAMLRQRSATGARKSHAEWAEAAGAQLEAMGWSGFRELSSSAFQARKQWDDLLHSVASLGAVSEPLRWAQFAAELQGFARYTLFAAESQNAPVQILGATEASGLEFDAIWFLQLTESRWPGTGRLHPLLAPAVQRDAGMPHASGNADFALAEQQLRRILSSAPHVVLSYARQVDGSESRISPQMRALDLAPLPLDTRVPQTPCAVVRAEESPVSAAWPSERAVGSDALKLQSACGFKSFAVRRLLAGGFEEEAWGLDPAERGILLHAALQELWSSQPAPGRLHSRDDLQRTLGDGSIDDLLQSAVERAFHETMLHASGDSWRLRFLALEQQRITTRLRPLLEIEQDRAPFRVVAIEREITDARIGDLPLRLRVDRIDEVAGETHLLLDYKTADVSAKHWFGDRPEEPQLPIYALFGGVERFAGIAFAQIRAGGKTRLHALVDDPAAQLGAPIKAAVLEPSTRDEWSDVLHRLAGEFLRGEAPVNPKQGAQTCKFCTLHGICRVREQAANPLADEEEESLSDA